LRSDDFMRVPFVDLSIQHNAIMNEINCAIHGVIEKNSYIGGKVVSNFEEKFFKYCGVEYGMGCGSGTAALHLALLACDVKPGDEVITTPHTFIATAEAISHCGAKPVFVDIDERTYNINPLGIEEAITNKTKAIIPVHLYGQCADMDPIVEIASKYRLKVIEDASQAHGAAYKGNKAGSRGDCACFSFYPGKNLGAFGDAGIVVTNNKIMVDQMRKLADHGRQTKYEHDIIGYNYRLDAIQAAILNVKLKYLNETTQQRKAIAGLYKNGLRECSDIILPFEQEIDAHVYHLFVIRSKQRDKLKQYLAENMVNTGVHFPIPLHLQKAYEYLGCGLGSFPITEQVSQEVLSLPMFPGLEDEKIERVIGKIIDFF
jgi:dTDP-4-amino-4,6-dideoxygalactose transaminase